MANMPARLASRRRPARAAHDLAQTLPKDRREIALTARGRPRAGYGGTAEQPILRTLAKRLTSYGIASHAVTFRTRGKRPSREYVTELQDLRAARDSLRANTTGSALVGRSFGGRMCAFLAADRATRRARDPRPSDLSTRTVRACGRGRRCRHAVPTLVVQGERDELRPLAVCSASHSSIRSSISPWSGRRPRFRYEGVPRQVEQVARWLDATLR